MPAPNTAITLESGRASARAATADEAAVLTVVIHVASSTAWAKPVVGSLTMIRPLIDGRPRALLPGNAETHLMPQAPARSTQAGIACNRAPAKGWTPGLGGISTRP